MMDDKKFNILNNFRSQAKNIFPQLDPVQKAPTILSSFKYYYISLNFTNEQGRTQTMVILERKCVLPI